MTTPIVTGRQSLAVTGDLTRSIWDSARGVRPDPSRLGKSVRIALSVTAPLVVGLLTHHVAYGLAATFGAFAGFHGHVEPYPQRARLLAAMAAGYVLAVMAGRVAALSVESLIVVTGLFAGAAAFMCQAFQLPAPREYMLVLICLINGALPHPLADPATLALLALAGASWAWIVLMSGWLVDRERPERTTVRAALQATLELLEAHHSDDARRHAAVLATRSARRSVEFAGGPTASLLRSIQLEAEDLLDRALGLRPPPTGEEAIAIADASQTGTADPRAALRIRLRELLEQTNLALPRPGFRRGTHDPRPALRSGLWSLRNAFGRHSLVVPAATRFGITVAAGLLIGQLSGAPRPYWIALTAAAVLQGATLLTSARRAIERAAGTAVGVLIGGGIVALDPSRWWIVAGIGTFLFLVEMTIAASYVVAVAFVTPMTLLLSEVGSPGQLTNSLVAWRLGDTVIGCLLGFLASRYLFPRAARQRLDVALLRTLDRIAIVLHPESEATREARRSSRHELRVQLLNLRAITDSGLGDRLTSSPSEDQLWPVAAAVQQLGYLALSVRGALPVGAELDENGRPVEVPIGLATPTGTAALSRSRAIALDRTHPLSPVTLDQELERLREHMTERCTALDMDPTKSRRVAA